MPKKPTKLITNKTTKPKKGKVIIIDDDNKNKDIDIEEDKNTIENPIQEEPIDNEEGEELSNDEIEEEEEEGEGLNKVLSDNEENVEIDEKQDDKEEKKEGVEYDTCIYDFADNDSENEEDIIFDDDDDANVGMIVSPNKRITKPILFKYERVRILGDRTQQLTLGAKPMVKNIENLTPKEIATLEITNNVIPLKIERPLPNGKKEIWYIRELKH